MTHDDIKVGMKVTFMANVWEDHKWTRQKRTGKVIDKPFWQGEYHYKCEEDVTERADEWCYQQTFECELTDILEIHKPPSNYFDG